MENELVYTQWKNTFTTSLIIAEKIEVNHRDILRNIRKLIIQYAKYPADIKDYIIKESQ